MSITSVTFRNFKALEDYSVSLRKMNVIVGPNNCGKSTIISAFRVLERALKTANHRRPTYVTTHSGQIMTGHNIATHTVPISLENVHTNYVDAASRIEFRYASGNKIYLLFPADGGLRIYWKTIGKPIASPSAFRSSFPDEIRTIPVLGPVEQYEDILDDQTVSRSAGTHRASRHFRNYWWKNPEGFGDFQKLVADSWPGMSIKPPERQSVMESRLTMFVSEDRIDRELYWSGLGFQIWCQLLTHISRCSETDMLIVDEPEVYLHPEVQRQLLGILREIRPDILLATHSVEILGEADPTEILLVDKSRNSARRLRDIEGVQQVLDRIGSIQNITLTELARNRRLLFVEGGQDYKIIRRFAKILGFTKLSHGSGLTALPSGGFDSWSKVKALAWGFRKSLGAEVSLGVVYDRDYRCDAETDTLKGELESEVKFAHFHSRKEIENYLLVPEVLARAVRRSVRERTARTGSIIEESLDISDTLGAISDGFRVDCMGQYVSAYCDYFKSSGKAQATLTTEAVEIFDRRWSDIRSRMEIVPGKEMLSAVRDEFQRAYGITLTDFRILDSYRVDEIPEDFKRLVNLLEEFRHD